MDAEKFLNFQMQMRENNMEVENFLNDFDAWKQTVELKSQHLTNTSQPELPAIRNSLLQKQKKKTMKQNVNTQKKVERIKAYDYQAWDKFVANHAVDDDDDNSVVVDRDDVDKKSTSLNGQTSSSSETTDEEKEDQRRIELSKEARELGNVRFKEGKFNEAIEQYTMAIRLTPEDSTPYINRAFAYIKTERYASAEVDCTNALRLDNSSVKAFYRRALARKGLGYIAGAIEDLKELLKFDSNNKIAQNELKILTGKRELDDTSKSSTTCNSSISSSSSSSSVHSNKLRKMRQIPIIEVGSSNDHHKPMSSTTPLPTQQMITKNSHSTSNANVQSSMSNSENSVVKTNEKASCSSITMNTPNSNVNVDNPTVVQQQQSLSSLPTNMKLYKTPSNWFQLERELRELCHRNSSSNHHQHQSNRLSKEAIRYLCHIQPINYKKLFGENMDSTFLSYMLYALCHTNDDDNQDGDGDVVVQLTNQHILDRLFCLTKLPRFDIAWMMITNEMERVNVRDLIKNLQNDHSLNQDVLKQISVQFEY